MIKGVIIDLDGVYFPKGKEEFIKNIIEKYKLEEEVVRTVFVSSSEMIDLLISEYKVNPEIERLVKALKGKEYTTIICTNNFPARIKGLDEKFHFLENFDVKIFSYNIGVLKPDPKIYKEVGEITGLENEEILAVDNGKENIRTQKSLGFVTIWYEGYLKLMEQLESLGVKV
jgi:HAD superfamily hydrolase (TIGR01509 family)